MSKNIDHYEKLNERLAQVRRLNNNEESKEEDLILDQMDLIWIKLNDEEKSKLNTKTSKHRETPN